MAVVFSAGTEISMRRVVNFRGLEGQPEKHIDSGVRTALCGREASGIIDCINQKLESSEIPAVEVYNQPRHMNQIHIGHFSIQRSRSRDAPSGHKNVPEPVRQFLDCFRTELGREADHETPLHVADAVIPAVKALNPVHGGIHGAYLFKKCQIRGANVIPGQQLPLEQPDHAVQ